MKKTNRTIPAKRPYSIAAIILIAVATALFLLKSSIVDNKKDTVAESSHSQTEGDQTTAQGPDQATKSPAVSSTPPPPNAAALPPAAATPDAEPAPDENSCQKITDTLMQFFGHLEKQEYIRAYALKEPIQTYLGTIITKILSNPPVTEKETSDLLTVLKNASHFYRILGRKDLSLLKDIMTYEHASLEQLFAALFAWSSQGEECRHQSVLKLQLPLANSYEYAAFFLNTLGGQSYLSRRDATVRVLTKYYSVLIINQAAQRSLNRSDINVPYHLESLIQDITNSDFLADQDRYLDTLKKIRVTPLTNTPKSVEMNKQTTR